MNMLKDNIEKDIIEMTLFALSELNFINIYSNITIICCDN